MVPAAGPEGAPEAETQLADPDPREVGPSPAVTGTGQSIAAKRGNARKMCSTARASVQTLGGIEAVMPAAVGAVEPQSGAEELEAERYRRTGNDDEVVGYLYMKMAVIFFSIKT